MENKSVFLGIIHKVFDRRLERKLRALGYLPVSQTRWNTLPAYLDKTIENLSEGLQVSENSEVFTKKARSESGGTSADARAANAKQSLYC